MLSKEEFALILFSVAVLFTVMVFGIAIIVVFQRKKSLLIQKQLKLKFEYENQIANAKNEIQENTLKNVAWELHDNIGQLLSVANMQINMMQSEDCKDVQTHLGETKTIIQEATKEVRSLSKTLNHEVIHNIGLLRSIEIEAERIERLKYAETVLNINGEIDGMNPSDEIIIFRIVQEFLSNVIKHAAASKIEITIDIDDKNLSLLIKDNGKGFDTAVKSESSGLQNMRSRAKLINAELQLTSEIGKGTELQLNYSFS